MKRWSGRACRSEARRRTAEPEPHVESPCTSLLSWPTTLHLRSACSPGGAGARATGCRAYSLVIAVRGDLKRYYTPRSISPPALGAESHLSAVVSVAVGVAMQLVVASEVHSPQWFGLLFSATFVQGLATHAAARVAPNRAAGALLWAVLNVPYQIRLLMVSCDPIVKQQGLEFGIWAAPNWFLMILATFAIATPFIVHHSLSSGNASSSVL